MSLLRILNSYSLHFAKRHGIKFFNPLNAELNPICHLLALLGAHPILHVSKLRVKLTKFSNFNLYVSFIVNTKKTIRIIL